jgi:hypothetical protein
MYTGWHRLLISNISCQVRLLTQWFPTSELWSNSGENRKLSWCINTMQIPGPFWMFIVKYVFWVSHFFFVYSLLLCAMLILLKPLEEAFLSFLVLPSKHPPTTPFLSVYNWNHSVCFLKFWFCVVLVQSLSFVVACTPCFMLGSLPAVEWSFSPSALLAKAVCLLIKIWLCLLLKPQCFSTVTHLLG